MQDFAHRGGVCLLKSQTSLDLTSLLETNFCKVATWQNSFEFFASNGDRPPFGLLSIAAARYFPQALAIPSRYAAASTYKRQKAGRLACLDPLQRSRWAWIPHDPMKSPWISRLIGSPRFWTLMRLVGACWCRGGFQFMGKTQTGWHHLWKKIWNIPNFFWFLFRTWSFIHQNADSSGKKWHSIGGRIVGTWRKPYCSNKPWNNTKSRKMLIRGDIGKAHVIWYGVIWYDVNNPLWSPKWSCWVLWLLVALPCFCSAGKSVFVESQQGPGPSWICLYI